MTLKNMGAASTIHVDVLFWWNTLKRRPPTLHTWLLHKSPSVGECGENFTTKFHPHKRPSWVKRKKWCQLYLAIKKEKVKKSIIIKNWWDKKRGRVEEDSPLLDLCNHQGLWSIHTIYVYDLSLVDRLSWTMCNQATVAATSKLHPHAAGK